MMSSLITKVSQVGTLNKLSHLDSISKQQGKEYSSEYTDKAHQFMTENGWYNRACLESVRNNFDLEPIRKFRSKLASPLARRQLEHFSDRYLAF